MTLEALMRQRMSCRAFLPAPVPDAVVDRMLQLAQRAPSWCNTQPWQVDVCSGAATERLRRELRAHIESADAAPAFDFAPPSAYSGVYRERRRASGWQLYDAVGVSRGDREASARQAAQNYEFFRAPHVAIVSTPDALGPYGAVDAGVYLGHLLLAAEACGVASVPQAAVARFAPFVREHLGIDPSRKIVFAVAFGYPDADHPANSYRTTRASLGEAVRHHRH
ncbi:MAG TPA: nitroreductase [Microbacterium sp.]|nr:nitroreductase [Microbacterium sp.]